MPLKIQSDSRQIPSIEKYTADKKYYDLLYGMLQEMSYGEKTPDDNVMIRYVNDKDFNFEDLGNKIGVSRPTVTKYFKNLITLKLIEEETIPCGRKTKKRYKLTPLDKSIATLVPNETLRKLNNSLNHNAISIYVYLLKRYVANKEQEFWYTRNDLKSFCGIAINTNSNDDVINDILEVLEILGLITRKVTYTEDHKTIN